MSAESDSPPQALKIFEDFFREHRNANREQLFLGSPPSALLVRAARL